MAQERELPESNATVRNVEFVNVSDDRVSDDRISGDRLTGEGLAGDHHVAVARPQPVQTTPMQTAPVQTVPVLTPAVPQEVRYLTEQEAARERLKASVDALTQQASLQAQMQKEPLKMIGGASAAGALVGLVIGRQFRRSKKIYVDADSPEKHQKALIKAQQKHQGNNVGGALAATLGTLAFKMVMDKVVTPRLEGIADDLLSKAGQPRTAGTGTSAASNGTGNGTGAAAPALPAFLENLLHKPAAPAAAPGTSAASATSAAPLAQVALTPSGFSAPDSSVIPGLSEVGSVKPVSTGGVEAFLKPAHPGILPVPPSKVEAKAVGTPISEAERHNPNAQ